MFLFVTIFTLAIFGLHYFLFKCFWSIFEISKFANSNFYFWGSVIFFSIFFTIANLLINFHPSIFSNFFYKFAAIWTGLSFWLLTATLIIYIFILIGYSNIKLVASILYSFAILINIYGLYNASNLRVVEQDIFIKDLPENWDNKKAVFISDTHYGPIHNSKSANKVVEIINRINSEKPLSYMFFSGDFYDGPKMDWSNVANEYLKLDSNIKKYFVSGNHEVYAQLGADKDILKAIQDAGFIVTNNTILNEDGVEIIGVDYNQDKEKDKNNIRSLFTKNDDTKVSIVLKHVPINIEVLSDEGADLVLSGHTHNGQTFPFNWVTYYMYKGFNHGLKYQQDTAVYTTSGVGSWGPPQRIGTQSEMVILNFKRKQEL